MAGARERWRVEKREEKIIPAFKSLEANSSQPFFSLLHASLPLASLFSPPLGRESARGERRITSGCAPLSERTSGSAS